MASSASNNTVELNLYSKLLNSKVYYINNSNSKYVNIGLNICDFKPRILIGGQTGFYIVFTEENWKNFLNQQGILVNYFHSNLIDTSPLHFDDITIYFEKINDTYIIKIQKSDGFYVRLAKETLDKLWDIEELINYRIQMLKNQEFEKYFNLFQMQFEFINPFSDLIESIYKVISPNQSSNSENVSTMLEMLCLYPTTVQDKIMKNGKKRMYEEISNIQ